MSFASLAEASVARLIGRFSSTVRIRNQAGTDDETVTCSAPIPYRSTLDQGQDSGDIEIIVTQSSLTFAPTVGYWAVLDSETYTVTEVETFGSVSYRLRLSATK